MNIEIANRLHQLRKKHNFSQEDLASRIGISRQAVSKWERAEASPDTDNLISLAKLYGVSLDELLMYDSYPLNPKEPVSLKKDNYAAANIGTPAMSVSPDGEIYPNRTINSASNSNVHNSQGNESFHGNFNNSNDGLFGNETNPFSNENASNASSNPDEAGFEKIDEYMSKIGNGLEASLGKVGNGLEKVGKVVGNNIDKAGNKIKEEINKSDKKKNENSHSTQSATYAKSDENYKYEYNYTAKMSNKHDSTISKSKVTLGDLVLSMIFVMLFGLTVSVIEEAAIAFLFAVPTLLTYKVARKKRNLLCFCYPTFVCMIFFGLGLFGDWTYELSWTLFLTIPLFYTLIPAIRKQNPFIFCYPVLVTYIFCISACVFNAFLTRWTWSLFLTIPFYYLICSHIRNERKNKTN